jgi:hypothetical protein
VEPAKTLTHYRKTDVLATALLATIRAKLNAGQILITAVLTTLKGMNAQSVLSDIINRMGTVITMFHIVLHMKAMEMTAIPAMLLMTCMRLKNALHKSLIVLLKQRAIIICVLLVKSHSPRPLMVRVVYAETGNTHLETVLPATQTFLTATTMTLISSYA